MVRDLRADRFFTEEQRRRLEQPMARWREARDAKVAMSPDEQAELEALVDAEIRAAAERAAGLGDGPL